MVNKRYCGRCRAELHSSGTYCNDCKPIISRETSQKERLKNEIKRISTTKYIAEKQKEIDRYNEKYGTRLNYGQYTALEGMGRLQK